MLVMLMDYFSLIGRGGGGADVNVHPINPDVNGDLTFLLTCEIEIEKEASADVRLAIQAVLKPCSERPILADRGDANLFVYFNPYLLTLPSNAFAANLQRPAMICRSWQHKMSLHIQSIASLSIAFINLGNGPKRLFSADNARVARVAEYALCLLIYVIFLS